MASTVQLLAKFEWPKLISDRAANSVCSVLVDASKTETRDTRLIRPPRRGRKKILNSGREYLDKRVQQWQETGVTTEELLGLVLKMKRGGHIPSR